MRLWQRVFMVALILTLIGTQLTAYLIAYKNFRKNLDFEKDRLITEHRLYIAKVENDLVYSQIDRGSLSFSLSTEETDREVSEIVKDSDAECGVLIMRDGLQIAAAGEEDLRKAMIKTGIGPKEGSTAYILSDVGDRTLALCCSETSLEYRDYVFYTSYDETKIYDDYHAAVTEIRHISYAVAIGIAVVLLVNVVLMLRPLDFIQKDINQIAKGNYDHRVSIKGSPELIGIAENINEMAAAIEENVGDIQAIADSRKQFIDNFAHEMKTPLTSIMGFADIIRIQRSLKDKQRVEYASIILEEAKRLRSLSGKLLELATSDKVQLEITEVDVSELFKEVYTSVIPMIVNHGMKLVVTCEPDITLQLDRELIKSLIYNLIDNAVKASKEGDEIRLDCRKTETKTAISVADSGTGMSEEHVKHVTEPFYMVDKSRSRKAGGAGLGLALCSEIAKQHGAKLKISSELGKGTIVMVVFG